jgi:hypothetical protein
MTNEQLNQLLEEKLKQRIIKLNEQARKMKRHKPLRPVKDKAVGEISFNLM